MTIKVKNIIYYALPNTVSSIISVFAILVCTKILGAYNYDNYYLLALFLPLNYVVLAISEAFRATTIALCAGDFVHGDKRQIFLNILAISLCVFFIFIVLILIYVRFYSWFDQILGIQHAIEKEFFFFSLLMMASGFIVSINYVLNALLVAAKKPLYALWFSALNAALLCAGTGVLATFFTMSWQAYFLSTLISTVTLIILTLYVLRTLNILEPVYNFKLLTKKMIRVLRIGIPVLLSYLLIFSSLFAINHILSHFSQTILIGFSLGYRMQNIMILPAVMIGTAIAVLTHQARVLNDKVAEENLLITGLKMSFCFYFVLSIFVLAFRREMISFITYDQATIQAGAT